MTSSSDFALLHPKYGMPTGGAVDVIDGVTFRPYRRGINLYSRLSEDFRIEVYVPLHMRMYVCFVDGKGLGRKFRTQAHAYRAGIAQRRVLDVGKEAESQ